MNVLSGFLAYSVAWSLIHGSMNVEEATTSSSATANLGMAVNGRSGSMNTIYGPTGLIVVPTAYVTADNHVNFSASFANELRGPAVNWAVIPGVEVGGAFMDREGADNKLIGNAKINIVPKNFDFFEVGIGVIDAADAISQTFYFVGSAALDVPRVAEEKAIGFRVHAGAGTGLFKEKLFGGAELVFDERFSVVGEWDTKNFNAALKYVHDSGFRIQLGFHHTNLYLGATYGLRF